MNKTLGRIAFEAYAKSKQGVTYDNKPIPEWGNLGSDVQIAWEAAAWAAANDLAFFVRMYLAVDPVSTSHKSLDRLQDYMREHGLD